MQRCSRKGLAGEGGGLPRVVEFLGEGVCHVAVVAARPVEQLLAAAGPGVCVLTLLHGGQVGSGVLVFIQVPAWCTATHTRLEGEGSPGRSRRLGPLAWTGGCHMRRMWLEV